MIVFLLSKKELVGKGLGMWIQGWRFSYSQRTGLDPELVVPKKNQRTSPRPCAEPPVLFRLFHEICRVFLKFPKSGNLEGIRDIRKVRKRQGEYAEFGHTQGEIKKNLQKSTY